MGCRWFRVLRANAALEALAGLVQGVSDAGAGGDAVQGVVVVEAAAAGIRNHSKKSRDRGLDRKIRPSLFALRSCLKLSAGALRRFLRLSH